MNGEAAAVIGEMAAVNVEDATAVPAEPTSTLARWAITTGLSKAFLQAFAREDLTDIEDIKALSPQDLDTVLAAVNIGQRTRCKRLVLEAAARSRSPRQRSGVAGVVDASSPASSVVPQRSSAEGNFQGRRHGQASEVCSRSLS